MHADRFGEVAVGALVLRDELAQAREDGERIGVVGLRERFPHLREFEHQHAPAGAGDARHLGQRAILVRHVAKPEGHAHAVEGIGCERQLLRIAHGKRREVARIDQLVAPDREHGRIDVGHPHAAPGADALGERERQVAAAGGHVEDLVALAHARERDGESLPHAMQAHRHQVVHEVVAGRDGTEDLADLGGLFGFVDFGETEVRLLTHGWPLRHPGAPGSSSSCSPAWCPARRGSPTNRCRCRGHRRRGT